MTAFPRLTSFSRASSISPMRALGSCLSLFPPALLAQGGNGEVDMGSMAMWSVVVLLLCAGLFWAFSWLRKRMKGEDDDISAVPAAGFTLADIRDLHKRGQMSAEEYERAKAKIL